MMWDVQKLLGQLPQPVVTILRQATPTLLEQMTEIRLRSGQPLVVIVGEQTLFLSSDGTAVSAEKGFMVPPELVQETMLSLCGHSLHGIEKTLERGFFTAQGGFRIGVCMQPYAAQQGRALSLCIRLPREVVGAASDVYSVWQYSQGLILAGPPASGKTTILRDLCRLISFGEGRIPTRTVLLDERNELGGWDGEKCAFQLGPCTDILSGLPKAEAVMRAVRTLSPQVILCDEIADEHEATAIQYAFFCGVHFVVTVHCGEGQEPFYNAMLRRLMQTGAFSHLYLLGLPAGKVSGTVVTRDEYGRKATGFCADFGRMHDDGLYPGGAASHSAADGSSAGTLLGGFSAADGTDRPAACADCGGAGGTERLSGIDFCAAVGVPTGGGLWNGIDRYNAKHGVAGSISKGNDAIGRGAGEYDDGSRETGTDRGADGSAAGGKILDRAGEPTGDAFPTAGNAGWIGVGGPAYLMEETAWKWISSSE